MTINKIGKTFKKFELITLPLLAARDDSEARDVIISRVIGTTGKSIYTYSMEEDYLVDVGALRLDQETGHYVTDLYRFEANKGEGWVGAYCAIDYDPDFGSAFYDEQNYGSSNCFTTAGMANCGPEAYRYYGTMLVERGWQVRVLIKRNFIFEPTRGATACSIFYDFANEGADEIVALEDFELPAQNIWHSCDSKIGRTITASLRYWNRFTALIVNGYYVCMDYALDVPKSYYEKNDVRTYYEDVRIVDYRTGKLGHPYAKGGK